MKIASRFLRQPWTEEIDRLGGLIAFAVFCFSGVTYVFSNFSVSALIGILSFVPLAVSGYVVRMVVRSNLRRYRLKESLLDGPETHEEMIDRAATLSIKNDSYFIALTWLKMSRAFICFAL